jgi:hypothetical protein
MECGQSPGDGWPTAGGDGEVSESVEKFMREGGGAALASLVETLARKTESAEAKWTRDAVRGDADGQCGRALRIGQAFGESVASPLYGLRCGAGLVYVLRERKGSEGQPKGFAYSLCLQEAHADPSDPASWRRYGNADELPDLFALYLTVEAACRDVEESPA